MNVIKRDNSYPYLSFAFTDNDDNPIDCSLYDISIVAKDKENNVVINKVVGAENSPAKWDNEEAGVGHYEWEENDTKEVGVFKYEFKFVRKSDGEKFSIPERGFFSYRVIEDIQIPTIIE